MSTESVSGTSASMTEHPDIVAMSARYERIAETPTAQATDGLMMLAGLFVALSPWIVGFSGSAIAVNNLIIGLTVTALGAGFAAAYERTHRLAAVCPLLGVWTVVAVWTMSGVEATTGVVLSNVLGGAAVILLGLAAMAPMYAARKSAR